MLQLTVKGDIITQGTVRALDVNNRQVAQVNVL
jgi:hypothetical protein